MGEAQSTRGLPDAAGGRALGGLAAGSLIGRFLADERGATAIEYALLIAILGLGVISSAAAISDKIYNVLDGVGNTMETAAGGG